MDIGVIITAIIGAFTTFTSGFASWFFTRKKYNSEVDSNIIANMHESLEFYKKLSDDNKARLEQLTERNLVLERELGDLRGQVIRLMATICTDLTCQLRKRDLSFMENHTQEEGKEA